MAYTVDQSSGTGLQGAWDDIFYVVRDTTNYNAPKFRYILQVTIDGLVIGKFKQLPNNNDCAVFDIGGIVSPYVYQDENIAQLGLINPDGSVGTTKIFATNEDAIKTITIDFGYEKAADADSAPTETMGAAAQTTFKVINGTLRQQTSNSDSTNSATNFALINTNGHLLSTANTFGTEITQYVIDGQYGVMAFLNGDDVGSNDCNYFHVTYKSASGVTLQTGYFQNNSTNGGYTPSASLSDERSLIYFGCFPGNLQSQGIDTNLRPDSVANWDYYEVQAASSTTLSGNESSKVYKFKKLCDTRYNDLDSTYNNYKGEYFLYWWNELGGVDSIVMDGASQVVQNITRENFTQIGGNAFNAGNTIKYRRRPSEGGMTTASNSTITQITLNTRALNPEALNPLIQSLANSERVFIYNRPIQQPRALGKTSAFVRCVVVDQSVSYKTAINDKVANYSITVQISRKAPSKI